MIEMCQRFRIFETSIAESLIHTVKNYHRLTAINETGCHTVKPLTND